MPYADRLQGLETSQAIKAPVRVATTAQKTLSGLGTVDGVALAARDRVLVKHQTDEIENGIYVAASGAWARSKDFNGARDVVQGTQVYVANGTASGQRRHYVTTADPEIGTTAIEFEMDPLDDLVAFSGTIAYYASRTVALAADVPAVVTVLQVLHNGMVLNYRRLAGATALVTNDGAEWTPADPKVYPEHYGIATTTDRAAAVDYTDEAILAFAAGHAEIYVTGWFGISDKVVVLPQTHLIFTRNYVYCGIVVLDTMNLSATSCLDFHSGTTAPRVTNLSMWFEQPGGDATVLADIIEYPWAVDVRTTHFIFLGDTHILRCWDGINGAANCGRSYAANLNIASFHIGMTIDGALGFVQIDKFAHLPDGMGLDGSGNALLDVYYEAEPIALNLGESDGFQCDNFSTHQASLVMNNTDTPVNGPYDFGQMILDGDNATVTMTAGRCLVATLHSTKGSPTVPTLAINGGTVDIGTVSMVGNEDQTILVAGGSLKIGGGLIQSADLDHVVAECTSGTMEINDVSFNWTNSGTRTAAVMKVTTPGKLKTVGCSTPVTTNTYDNMIQVVSDVAGNYVDATGFAPHDITLPATVANGTYMTVQRTGNVTVTLVTPGNFAPTYNGVRTARWSIDRDFVRLHLRFACIYTLGTGTGAISVLIPSMPALSAVTDIPLAGFKGFTFTGGRTMIMARLTAVAGELTLLEYGPGLAFRAMDDTNLSAGAGSDFQIFLTGNVSVD